MTIANLKLGHQQQIENAVALIALKHDDCPTGLRLCDKITMGNTK